MFNIDWLKFLHVINVVLFFVLYGIATYLIFMIHYMSIFVQHYVWAFICLISFAVLTSWYVLKISKGYLKYEEIDHD